MNYKNTICIILIIIMIYMSIKDLLEKKVGLRELLIYLFISIINFYIRINKENMLFDFYALLLSMIVGIIVVGLSIITREGIGKADAIFFIINAFNFYWYENLYIFICGLFFSCIISLFVFIFKKNKKVGVNNIFIPFFPCVLPFVLQVLFKNWI
ncbi:MAG: hypothetical protein Q4F88_03170 [Eubacteriales bacterium]|nr:hypothetical protein [Eubacteriales bacterium]